MLFVTSDHLISTIIFLELEKDFFSFFDFTRSELDEFSSR